MNFLSPYQRKTSRLSNESNSYAEWYEKAQILDLESGMMEWRDRDYSSLYDFKEIRERLSKLRKFRRKKDDLGLLFTLNEGIHGNMGGMGSSKLHSRALSGTKRLIEDYIDEITDSLLHLSQVDNPEISPEEKIDFFQRASHCFGRTSLMLSGGGQLGNFHMGVLKVMIEQNILPNIISGSSAGSVFAALVGTYSHQELVQFFRPENILVEVEKEQGIINNLFTRRSSVKAEHLRSSVDRLIPNLTFQEAYAKTGKHINISIAPYESHQKSRLLNAIASPNVLIRSAVMASCAIPGIYSPVTLMAKNKDGQELAYLPERKWVDGSMSNDLPSKRLSRLYGANHFIVSLTNPVILPFISDPTGQNDFTSAIIKFGRSMIKETTQLNYSIAKPFFKFWPKMAAVANGINSVVQQDYLGDINIKADFSVVKPLNLLKTMTYDELSVLIEKGEKATWPKVEQIRTTTKIGNLLDQILDQLESTEVKLARRGRKNPSRV